MAIAIFNYILFMFLQMLQVTATAWGGLIAFAYITTILIVQMDITTVLGFSTVQLASFVAATNVCLLCWCCMYVRAVACIFLYVLDSRIEVYPRRYIIMVCSVKLEKKFRQISQIWGGAQTISLEDVTSAMRGYLRRNGEKCGEKPFYVFWFSKDVS